MVAALVVVAVVAVGVTVVASEFDAVMVMFYTYADVVEVAAIEVVVNQGHLLSSLLL